MQASSHVPKDCAGEGAGKAFPHAWSLLVPLAIQDL